MKKSIVNEIMKNAEVQINKAVKEYEFELWLDVMKVSIENQDYEIALEVDRKLRVLKNQVEEARRKEKELNEQMQMEMEKDLEEAGIPIKEIKEDLASLLEKIFN